VMLVTSSNTAGPLARSPRRVCDVAQVLPEEALGAALLLR